jgi:hypothetical protein
MDGGIIVQILHTSRFVIIGRPPSSSALPEQTAGIYAPRAPREAALH